MRAAIRRYMTWRRTALWYRCSDPSRPNDVRMRWHYEGCGRCAGAARALGRKDVLAEMKARRVTP